MNVEPATIPCIKGHDSQVFIATKACVQCVLEMTAAAPWEIMTRKEALEKGLKKYWTGKICGNGHVRQRYTSSSICTGCNAMNTKRYNKDARAKLNALHVGFIPIKMMVHPEDVATVTTLIENMNEKRRVG